MDEQEQLNQLIDIFILAGLLEVAGVDSRTGDFIYQFTPKLKEVDPELFYEIQNNISNEIMALWAAGFLDIRMDGEDAMVMLTEKCTDADALDELSPREQEFLLFIIEKMQD